MEKRLPPNMKHRLDAKTVDQKLTKIKDALKNVNWDYGTLFEDINGFIETQGESSQKLRVAESEKRTLSGQLQKSEQRVQLLTRKFQEHQGELSAIKRAYQLKFDELLAVKSEAVQKLEQVRHSKALNDSKAKELIEVLKKKDELILQYKNHIQKSETQLVALNKSFVEKLNLMKQQILEKSEQKEKALEAKNTRLISEREETQKHTTELMSENARLNQEIQKLGKTYQELNQMKENFMHQKNILMHKVDETTKLLKLAQSRITVLDLELKKAKEKDFEQQSENKKIENEIAFRNQEIQSLKTEINRFKKQIDELQLNLQKKEAEQKQVSIEFDELKNIRESYRSLQKIYAETKESELKVKQDVSDLVSQLHALSLEKTNQDKIVEAYSNNISILKDKEEDLRNRYEVLVVDHENEINHIVNQKTELQENLSVLTAKTSEYKNLILGKNEELELKTQRITELTVKASNDDQVLKETRDELESAKKGKSKIESEMHLMLNALTDMKNKVIQKSHEIVELKKRIEGLQSYESKFNDVSSELELEKNQNKALLNKISEAVNRVQFLEKENERVLKDKEDSEFRLKAEVQGLICKSDSEMGEIIQRHSDEMSQVQQKHDESLRALTYQHKAQIEEVTRKHNDEMSAVSLKHKTQMEEVVESHTLEVQSVTQDLQAEILKISNTLESEKKESISKLRVEKDEIEQRLQAVIFEMSESAQNEKLQIEEDNAKASKVLNQKIAMLQNTLDDAQSVVEFKGREIESLSIKLQEYENSNLTLNEQNDSLNSQIVQLKDDLAGVETKNAKKQEQILDLKQKLDELTNDLSVTQANLEQKNIDFKFESERALGLEADLQTKGTELTEAREEILNLTSTVEGVTKTVSVLISDKSSLGLKIKELSDEISILNTKLSFEKKSNAENVQKYDSKFQAANQEIESLLLDQKSLNGEIQGKDTQIVNLQTELQKSEAAVVGLSEDLELNLGKVSGLEQKELELVDRIKQLESQNAELGLKIVQAAEKYDESFRQKLNLEAYVEEHKELYASVKRKSVELEASMQSLLKREDQLSLYSRWVDSQNGSIQKQVLKIASELKATKNNSPLNHYLKITEREISKIEVLMTRSNVFGPQRIQLENQYELLVRQRDEVRELVTRTNGEVEERANALISTLKSSEFIPVPPLPPGQVIEGETEVTNE